MKKSLGFTLIELMITIAILAILIGIGVPSYQNTVQQSRIDDATTLINSSLSYAKNAAIAHNRTLYMTASANTLILATNTSFTAETINKTAIGTDSNSTLSFSTTTVAIKFHANGTVEANGTVGDSGTVETSNTIRYCTGDRGVEMLIDTNGEPVTTTVSC